MIKFFRRIRQNLFMENKTGKYLKYAIGEILLVVVGILIALQINNWNEKKKFKAQDQLYLIKMKEDLETIRSYMQFNLEKTPKDIQNAQLTLYSMQYCEIDDNTKPIIENTLLTAGNLGTVYAREATYTEMLANGSFSRMKNDSLKNNISDLYGQLTYLNHTITYFRSELGEANKIIWNHIQKEFKPEIDIQTLSEKQIDTPTESQIKVKYDFSELCQSSIFKNALVEVIDSRKDVYSSSTYVYQHLSQTIELLNSEITSSND